MSQRIEGRPQRLVDEPSRPELGELLRRVRSAEPGGGAREASWKRIDEKLFPSRRRRLWIPTAIALMVVLVGVFWLLPSVTSPSRQGPQRVETPAGGEAEVRIAAFDLRFGGGTSAQITSSRGEDVQIELTRGTARVLPGVSEAKGRARVLATGTSIEGVSFEVRVASDGTLLVSALQDSVEVVREGHRVQVPPGGHWSSHPAPSVTPATADEPPDSPPPPPRSMATTRPRPPPTGPKKSSLPPQPVVASNTVAIDPVSAPTPAEGGGVVSDAERWAEANRRIHDGRFSDAVEEFDAIAAGQGPYAGMALYESGRARAQHLGDFAGAQRSFAAYRERFPAGALRQEVELGALEAFVSSGDLQGALAAADQFLARFPGSVRAADVRLLRANVLRDRGNLNAARADYSELEQVGGGVGAEALYAGAFCARQLGDEAGARIALEAYLSRYPNGSHRKDALQALGRTE